MEKEKRLEKTKTSGVYKDTKLGTYVIQTTFTTKDKIRVKVCKRGFTSEKKAKDEKTRLKVYYSETYGLSKEQSKSPMEKIINEYINYKSKALKPETIVSTTSFLKKYVLPYFDSPKDINVKTINNFYLELSNNKKIIDHSKNIIISKINSFFEYLEMMEIIDSHTYHKYKQIVVKFNTTEPHKSSYITFDDFKKLIISFDKKDNEYKLFFIILFFTGCRKSEALALKYSDVDFENGTILFNKQVEYTCYVEKYCNGYEKFGCYTILPYTKTNTIKIVTIQKWILDLIKFRQQQNNNEFIFTSSRKNNTSIYNKSNLNIILSRHLKMCNLDRIKIHDLRHSHITMLYDMGCDSKYVAERVGHKTEATSQNIYKHLTNAKKVNNDNKVLSIEL